MFSYPKSYLFVNFCFSFFFSTLWGSEIVEPQELPSLSSILFVDTSRAPFNDDDIYTATQNGRNDLEELAQMGDVDSIMSLGDLYRDKEDFLGALGFFTWGYEKNWLKTGEIHEELKERIDFLSSQLLETVIVDKQAKSTQSKKRGARKGARKGARRGRGRRGRNNNTHVEKAQKTVVVEAFRPDDPKEARALLSSIKGLHEGNKKNPSFFERYIEGKHRNSDTLFDLRYRSRNEAYPCSKVKCNTLR